MLTQIATIKTRLALSLADLQYDAILEHAIKGVSAQFDLECARSFARAVNTSEEFPANDTEICVASYPIESVTRFELKEDEASGWTECQNVQYLVRAGCVISVTMALGSAGQLARVVYTGGYVLPGDTPGAGQTVLPDELEQAAVEQVASWFLHRDKVGLIRNWPSGGVYQQFMPEPLLPSVLNVLRRHTRWLA